MYAIENISHACLKYEFKDFALLTDPWITNDPIKSRIIYKFPPQAKEVSDIIKRVKYIYISHSHEDHFHIPSLLKFPKDTQFLITDYDFANAQGGRNGLIYSTLIGLGYLNIKVLKPWVWVSLTSSIKVCLIPSAKTRYMDWENSGLAVESEGIISLNMNDNVVDTNLAREIRERIGPIDIYFVQSAGISTFPACFDMRDECKNELIKKKTQDYKMHDLIIKECRPSWLIPYAGDFGWFGEWEAHTKYSRDRPHGLISHIYSKKVNTALFEPTDQFEIDSGRIVFQKNTKVNWDNYEKLYNSTAALYRKSFKKIDQRFNNEVIKQWLQNIKSYFFDLALFHQNGPFLTDFDSEIVYKITDKQGDSILFHLIAKKGKNIQITFVTKMPKTASQIHQIMLKDFLGILSGEYMLSEIQWRTKISQENIDHSARMFIFWINYYIDKGNRTPQFLLAELDRKNGAKNVLFHYED